MKINLEAGPIQPAYNPGNPGVSLDRVEGQLSIDDLTLAGTVIGDATSRLKGRGSETDGLRSYRAGDSPRDIDWNATARQTDGWPKVRMQFKDINPDLYIVTNLTQSPYASGPMHFSKQNLGMSAIASFLSIAGSSQLPSAVIAAHDEGIFTDEVAELHEDRTMQALTDLTRIASGHDQSRERKDRPYLDDVLRFASERITESIVVVLSDFRDVSLPNKPEHGWGESFRRLLSRDNSVIAVEVTNPWDFQLPPRMTKLQRGGRTLRYGGGKVSNEREQRRVYASNAVIQAKRIAEALSPAMQHLQLSTSDPNWPRTLTEQLGA